MSSGAAVSVGSRKRTHISTAVVGAADPAAPLLSEVQTAVTADPTLWGNTLYYTGDALPASNPTYVYEASNLGIATLLFKPETSVNGLIDAELNITSPSGVALWNQHTTVKTAAADDIVILDASSNGSVGDILEVFNATANILTLQLDGSDSSSQSSFDPIIGPNSGFSCRIVAANTIEIVGTGMSNFYSNGVDGYVIQGDVMFQWGVITVTSEGLQTLDFHTSFGLPPYFVSVSENYASTGGDDSAYSIDYSANTKDAMVLNPHNADADNTGEYRYLAIGQRP